MALSGNVVVRRLGEPDLYADTVDLTSTTAASTLTGVTRPSRTRYPQPTMGGDW